MRRHALTALLLAFAALALLVAPALAQLPKPPPVEDGEFTGTWYRVEPGQRQALQVRRADDGNYALRFYWWTDDGIEIDTGWNQRFEYYWQQFPGSLTISIDQEASSDERLVADYVREQGGTRGAKLLETGRLEIYRAEDGRKLIWAQDELRRQVTVEEPRTPAEAAGLDEIRPRVWIMRKASKRELLWDEIPW